MLTTIAIIVLFIGLVTYSLVNSFDRSKDRYNEYRRIGNRFAEVDDGWNSKGRLYSSGLTVLRDGNRCRFIKQSKLVDLGILD